MTPSTQRLVIFDCDGTLVDSQYGIIASMEAAFQAHGLPAPAARDVRRVVGLPLDAAIAALRGPDSELDSQAPTPGQIAAAFREDSEARRLAGADTEPTFPGVREVLSRLIDTGISLGVATGKSRRGLQNTLLNHDLGDFFQVLKTADDGPGKPDPAILQDAMAEIGADPDSTIVIGDTTFDIQMAVNARALSIGVSWGYHETGELTAVGANRIARSFGDLPDLIDTLWGHPANCAKR
ncbi:MAG: HAD-IA family hydrolase [Alphaproteobacteria bacterium]|nr:HAD-IA family hydrolase [Alphaproteobacteria bacterium]